MLVITRRQGEEVVIGDPANPIGIVRIASIKGDVGLMALQVDGDEEEVEAALAWIESEGVTVEPIAKGDAV